MQKFLYLTIICLFLGEPLLATAAEETHPAEARGGSLVVDTGFVTGLWKEEQARSRRALSNRHKVDIIFSYAHSLGIPSSDFDVLLPWVLSPKDASSMVSIKTMADVLSTRLGRPLSEEDLVVILEKAERLAIWTERYYVCKEFAKRKLREAEAASTPMTAMPGGVGLDNPAFDRFLLAPSSVPVVFPSWVSEERWSYRDIGVGGFVGLPGTKGVPPIAPLDRASRGAEDEGAENRLLEMLSVLLGHDEALCGGLEDEWRAFWNRHQNHREAAFYDACFTKWISKFGFCALATEGATIPTTEEVRFFECRTMSSRDGFTESSRVIVADPASQAINYFKGFWGPYLVSTSPDPRYVLQAPFLMCSQSYGDERSSYPFPEDEMKERTKLEVRDGKLYREVRPLSADDGSTLIWVLGLDGELFASILGHHFNHSFFVQRDGIGQPIACGGHMNLRDGKITTLNNASGHYMPNVLHLALATRYLHAQGVFADNARIEGHGLSTVDLKTFLQVAGSLKFED